MAATKTAPRPVTVVNALSTRTLAWWCFKRLTPGAAATLTVVYVLPAIYAASGQ